MIHAAIMGSIERFISIMIEHHAGSFPVWISPVQISVLPITDKHADYAKNVLDLLQAQGLRVELNDKNEPLNARIRDAQLQKIPYMLIIGDREMSSNVVSVRLRSGEDLKSMPLEAFSERANQAIAQKSQNL